MPLEGVFRAGLPQATSVFKTGVRQTLKKQVPHCAIRDPTQNGLLESWPRAKTVHPEYPREVHSVNETAFEVSDRLAW